MSRLLSSLTCTGRPGHRRPGRRLCITRTVCSEDNSSSTFADIGVDECGDVFAGIVASRPNVVFRSELWSTSDSSVMNKSMRRWRSRASKWCAFYDEEIIDVNQLEPDCFEMKWRATWVPSQLLWLDKLGKAWPGISVQYYNILDRCECRMNCFAWRNCT